MTNKPKSVIRISQCSKAVRNPNDRFGFKYWLKQYASEAKDLSLQQSQEEEEMSNRIKENYKDENLELKKRIRDLEKALEFSKLETLARDMMIDKAEEYFDIQIRKKSGAK